MNLVSCVMRKVFRKVFRLRQRKFFLGVILLLWVGMVGIFTFQEQNKNDAKLLEYRLRRYFDYKKRLPHNGPGENGKAVTLAPDEEALGKELWKNASFNVLASDKIALDRSIPDTRQAE